MRNFTRWLTLVSRGLRIVAGRSYYHQPQRLGKVFKPGELAGYFNDLTSKVKWIGETDEGGIPVNVLADGRRVHFATTIAQKALGHWDLWLLKHKECDKCEFLKLTYWLLHYQDGQGGWPVWAELGITSTSRYSAMTQGECISALLRAWKITNDPNFAEGARQALNLLCRPLEQGGPSIIDGDDLFLEEVPSIPRSSILNGWIFALFGLYDAWNALKDKTAGDHYQQSLCTLKRHLFEYDADYWSHYDVQGHLASSFYHDLHIHQLSALALVNRDPVLVEFRDRWVVYQRKVTNRTKAFYIKAFQKMREPGEVIFVR